MTLRWKLLLSYLLTLGVVLLTISLAFRGVATRAATSHMGRMAGAGMGGMMGGRLQDLQEAVSAGVGQAILVGVIVAGIVAIAASLAVAVWVTRPLAHMAEAARRIANGHYDQRVQYRAHDEIGDFSQAFNEMAAKLETTEKLRSELLATIAHELRTPLTTIQGYMEGLIDGVIPEEPQTYEMVRGEAGRLSRLVGDIQRLSRLEAGAEHFEPQSVEVAAALQRAAESVRPLFEEKDLRLALESPEGLPKVWADPDKLHQVLLNLLTNAYRYTPDGGSVVVHAREDADAVIFSVTDTGIGIPEDDLPHIFERFYRVDKSRSSGSGGSGIGLAVTKSLVEQSGGAVSARSVPGEGTTVSFTLPKAGREPADEGA
jgi:signal transduction histidine kinase